MLKISGPVGAALFVTAILAAGTSAGLSIGSARADDCLAAPKGAAPQGQHWYYHVDRATRRKCWYLHGAMPLRHHAVTRHHATQDADAEPAADPPTATAAAVPPAPSTAATAPPAPAATAPAPVPESAAVDSPPAPHVTVLAVKTVTPFVGTTALPRQNASEQPPAPAAAQPPSRDGDMPAVPGGVAAKADGAAPQAKADTAFGASAQPAEAATDAARTRTAEGFILLAAVFGVAAALTAIVSKFVGMYRTPRILLDPDAAWVNYRSVRRHSDPEAAYEESDVPFLDPQEHYGLGDLHEQEWLDRSAPDQSRGSAPPQVAESAQSQSPRPILGDIEAALQALRQARQSRVT